MNISLVGELIWLVIGIQIIVSSFKNKEKLGKKAMPMRVAGIIIIIIGIVFLLSMHK